ncbi:MULTISPECIES: hypothetical protein [Alphaproteobacteria]
MHRIVGAGHNLREVREMANHRPFSLVLTRKARLTSATILCSFLLVTPALATANSTDIVEQSHSEAIAESGAQMAPLREQLTTDVELTELIDIMRSNTSELREIVRIVTEAGQVDDVIDEVSDRLDRVTESFERIAEIGPSMLRRRAEIVSDIERIQRAASLTAAEARGDVRRLEAANQALKEKLRSGELSETEARKTSIDISANETIIQSRQVAVDVWAVFIEQHAELVAHSGDITDEIDVFTHTLGRNAEVYGSVAEVFRLRRNLATVLADMQSLSSVVEHANDLENGWRSMHDALDRLREEFPDYVPSS